MSLGDIGGNSIAKRADWLDLQMPSIKARLRIMKNVHRFEDFRPSLKKLIFGSAVDRYSEFFKSPNTPDPDSPLVPRSNPEIDA